MKPRLLGLLLILAALLSLSWWMNELTHSPETRPQSAEQFPDSYAEGLVVRTYSEKGTLKQKLVSTRMQHYQQTGVTELQQPILWQFNEQTQPWKMQAEEGLVKRREETIFLPGKVVIDRSGDESLVPYHILTQDLTLQFKDSFASTEQPVRIESGSQWVTAVGMEAWLKQPMRLKLLHQVRGYYDFN
ncbi:MAG: LPS export ABC transporter periplasmic protein LptC [Candidatus Thiodiazotropha sp. (ex Lucinoma borealis)]|nr:LPS export ABC transporter periplasmic protein LptC [Candidatus Thiodiazotropha sp. (ex Lucinoma borealis)]MCU7856725.1 LPS export ABC transporter periplasmic protein LptC [Candidatus Thiodiazotropha sp. (ex Lucinoma borealis)]MCU7864565.1 LPS export ABC transporter periplasmic protein LptC [Candidatus Thiodiazotropha sp. (ex Lucinoma borealis)]MCU7870651.1 LPS export ABC transporter periplasmic protein LptC [Candidatus Thiodiazotropha sp. (ex Lucinoma borealis)]MCU7946355.1 LPS export ABC t